MGGEFNSRLLPSSNIGACLRGIINRACDNEIKNIHVMDTKTQDHYISGCGPSSAGISSSDQGITTILPLLLYTTQPASRVNYIAYYFKNGSLWTSAFTPWHQGNFTGSRRITCLFTCISYTMVAVRLMSEPLLQPSLQEFVVVSPMGFDITMGMVIKAAGVSAVLFPFLILIELLCRTAPTLLSSCGRPAAFPVEQSKNLFENTSDSSQLKKVQSAPSHFSNSSGDTEHVKDRFPQKSVSAPDMLWQGTRPTDQSNQKQNTDMTSLCNNIANQCVISSIPSCIDIKPDLSINSDLATNISKNVCGDSKPICAADRLECHHKLTCLDKCAVCHRTAGSKYYDPGAGCSQETASVRYNMYNPEGLYHLGSANSSSRFDSECSSTCSLTTKTSFSSSSISISSLDSEESTSSTLTNVTPLTNNSCSTIDLSDSSTSLSCTDMSELASITDSSVTSYQWPEDYNVQGSNNAVGSWDECCIAPSTPPLNKLSRQQPDSITRATSISGLLKKEHMTPYKQETHQHSPVTGSDYIVDLPIEFEMPEVTVQKSINHTSFFFRLRKWLKGFCSKSKKENDAKYKVKEAEMLAVMKTYLTHMPTVPSVDSETNIIATNNHCATRSTGIFCESIFLTPSQVIENQLDTLSFSSSGSWSSITSAQEEAERKMIGLDHTNENNNNEVSTIEIRPCEEPTTRLPVSTNSDSAVAMDGIQSSSTLSTSDTDSLRNDIIISKDSANGKQDISQGNQSLSEIKPTASSKHCARSCFSILAAFVQIFLIISCIFATLWSVSSVPWCLLAYFVGVGDNFHHRHCHPGCHLGHT
ncbi:uncharacterized protein LOC110988600 [Acanthaster planci]|uniref:Uncharacterized protein LOC110988600 n=1 Tax=Acanthaster planci TaxID=133434 RepID=A0A8B7ZRG3_ACAPL|nr:uncharacterized protein LOC110988600 [Acanthaster planci]